MLPYYNLYIKGEHMLYSVLFIDNAYIYKTQEVYNAITIIGVCLIFLLLYSPNFNPIKLNFAILKAGVRHNQAKAANFNSFREYLKAIIVKYRGKNNRAQFKLYSYPNKRGVVFI